MKAAVVEKPGVLVVREVPDPVMGEYDALCENLYCATCSGTDHYLIKGKFPFPIQYPGILGHEAVGRVIKAGAKVRNFLLGDRVLRTQGALPPNSGVFLCWGGFAEYGIARDHQAMKEDGVDQALWNGYRVNRVVPAELDSADATMVITWRETFSYITRMGVGYNDRVLVIGSGANGLSYVNHAANLMASKIVMVANASRLKLAEKLGAERAYDYKRKDLVETITNDYPEGFNFIIDAIGKAGTIDDFMKLLTPDGTVGIYGIHDFYSLAMKPLCAWKTFRFYNGGYDEAETHVPIMSLVKQGRLAPRDFYDRDRIFPLEKINEAFEALERREMIKAVIKIRA